MKKHFILIILIIFIAYANSLVGDFIYDDYFVIVDNDFIKSWRNTSLIFDRRYLSHPMEMTFNMGTYNIGSGETTYRPVVTLTYFLNYALFKLNPRGYRFTNILLHIINAILIYLLLNALFKNQLLSLFSALLFGIHPLNAGVVNCTGFRPNVLVFLFSVLSIILYFKYRVISSKQRRTYLFASLLSFFLAIFSKEIAIVLPLALIAGDLFHTNFQFRKILINAKIYLLYFIIDIFYVFIYFFVFPPQQKIIQMPITVGSFFYNFLQMPYTLGAYLKDILFPKDLVPILSPITLHYTWVILAVIIIAFSAYVFLMRLKALRGVAFSVLWFFIWFVPVSNFIYSLRIFVAYRYLYIPFLGVTCAFGLFFIKIWNKNCKFLSNMFLARRIFVLSCFAYFLIFTVSVNVSWRNDVLLYSSICKKYPLSATAHAGLGVALLKYGKEEEVEKEFNTVLSLSRNPELFRPFSFALASIYLGRLYNRRGKFSKAEQMYLQALGVFPNSARIYTELGSCYNKQGLYGEALDYFNKAKHINPRFLPAYINSGISYKLMHKYSDAKNEFLGALEIYPQSKEANDNLSQLEAIWREQKR